MTTKTVLALDLGTSGLKAAVVTDRGVVVDSEVVPLSVALGPGGAAEQQPESWWSAVVTAAHALWARGRAKPSEVVGIGVSSQWGGTVAVDEAGAPLRPALIWMDSRGADEVKRLVGGFPTVDGYGALKALKWLRVTGGLPSLSGKDPVGHIAWLKRHEPDTYARAHRLLEPKDWLNLRLTGRACGSYDSMTLHWATDNRRVDQVRYDPAMLKLSELDQEKLPELVAPQAIVGTLGAQAARALALSPTVQVASGAGDMHMAAIGAGTVRDFEPHLCLGTSSWLLAHVPFKKADVAHNMASLPSAIFGRYLFCNEQETAAAGLKLVVEQWLGGAGPQAYAAALAEAEQVPAGAEGLTYLPWLHGERSPIDDRHVRGGFVGLSLEHGRGHLVRAVLEGVALNGRWLLTHLEANLGRRCDVVTVVGGGARSALWCQVHADVFGRVVRQVEAPQLANARGAAFQAWVALGALSWADVPALVPIARTFEPAAANRGRYDARYEQFLSEFKHRRATSRRYQSESA